MTVSPDARTPSASVHALSGSTPPGAARPVQPFGIATAPAAVAEMPDTFAPLGAVSADVVAGLAARRAAAAHPDAAVIDLAGRVKALVPRELRLVLRTVEIEDAVMQVLPPRPERAESALRIVSDLSTEEDGTRVMTVREPAGWEAENRAGREAHEAALAERAHHEEREEARRGLPRWMKLRERATCRLERWGLQLAAMEPATQAGLAAKAAASVAVAEGDELPDGWRQALAISLSRDAVRMLGADADTRTEQDQLVDPFAGFHAEIMALHAVIAATDEDSPEQEAAWDRWKEIDGLILGSHPTTFAGAIGALDLARREHHQFSIENCEPDQIGMDDRLIQHALVSALAVLRPLADRGAPPQANLRPAPLPTGMLAGRYPAGAPRDVVETYRTFLEMELRFLNHEVYGQTEGRLHYWLNNPAGSMHGGGEPPASSRAAAVLNLLGLMPGSADAAPPCAASAA